MQSKDTNTQRPSAEVDMLTAEQMEILIETAEKINSFPFQVDLLVSKVKLLWQHQLLGLNMTMKDKIVTSLLLQISKNQQG